MATSQPSVAGMLLELCVTELEDVALNNNNINATSIPVIQESSHPYTDDVALSGHVKIPGKLSSLLLFLFEASHCWTLTNFILKLFVLIRWIKRIRKTLAWILTSTKCVY